MNDSIYVTRSSLPPYAEYCAEIKDIWDTGILTNMGEKHQRLETALKAYLCADNLTLFTNGHLALEGVLEACGLSGEVITTPFTFASTTHAIIRRGLTPVFCDIDPNDFTLDVTRLEALISEKTCAIIPVHVYGTICNDAEIERIAAKHGLKVIYDAAHTFGETIDGKGIATLGDASMFSFHATKVFNTIEGGAVAFRDAALASKMDMIKNFGLVGAEAIEYPGGNAKMNEFQAAMGLCNLRHLKEAIAKRALVSQRYYERFDGIRGIKLRRAQQGVSSNFAYFPVLFSDSYNRDEIAVKLAQNGIFARKYFYPLTNSCACYGYNGDSTPVAKETADRVLCLPIYAELEQEQVDRICDIILSKE